VHFGEGVIEVISDVLEFFNDGNDGTMISEFLAGHDLDEGIKDWTLGVS